MAIAATRNRQTCTTRWLIGIAELAGTALSRLGRPDRHHAEALGLDAERHVELAAEVLERHRRGQLDDLGLVEERADPPEQVLAHALAGDGHGLRVLEGGALHRREARALPPGRHLAHLLLVRSCLHPPGCVDVNSE